MIFISNSHIYFSKTFDRVWKLLFVLFAFVTPFHFLCIFFCCCFVRASFFCVLWCAGGIGFWAFESWQVCRNVPDICHAYESRGICRLGVCVCVRVCVTEFAGQKSHGYIEWGANNQCQPHHFPAHSPYPFHTQSSAVSQSNKQIAKCRWKWDWLFKNPDAFRSAV